MASGPTRGRRLAAPALRSLAAPALLTAAMGTVYASTLLPGLGSGDVAKLQFVGHVLGSPHAPGYPLYLGASFVFSHALPIGSVAWRANLLSALFAVAALLVLFAVLRVLGCRPLVAASAAAAAGLLPAVWSQAVVAEVYTLHLLVVLATVLLLLRWQERRTQRRLIAALAVFSLGFAHHLTVVTMLPAVLAFVVLVDQRVGSPWRLAGIAPLPFLGLLPYGYFFWRTARANTSYLEMQTPDFATLIWYLGGAQFRERVFAFGPGELLAERLPLIARMALAQLRPMADGVTADWRGLAAVAMIVLVTVAAVVGLGAVRGAARHALLLGVAAGGAVFALGYDIPDLDAYLLPVYVVAAIYAGVGAERLLARGGRIVRPLTGIALVVVPVALFSLHRPAVDRSDVHPAEVWAASALAALDARERGSKVVIAADYGTYETLQYLRQVGTPDGGPPRRDLLVLTPVLADAALDEIRAFVDRHRPPPLIRAQLLATRTPASIRRYLDAFGELDSFEERYRLPAGLPVYALGEAQAALLADAGLAVSPVAPAVFRVAVP